MRHRGFTLLEVNLAMFVMAAGILIFVTLYSLGFRENRQSMEDVRGVAVAEANLNLITAALSSTNMTWSQWTSIGMQPQDAWATYAGTASGGGFDPIRNPTATARTVMAKVPGLSGGDLQDGGLKVALVLVQNGSKCSVALRSGLREGSLLFQPLYYTEVCYQGFGGQPQGGGNP